MDALRRASATLFYAFGLIFVVTLLMYRQGWLPSSFSPVLFSADLPLLFVAMLFGGTSLYRSLLGDRRSTVLSVAIFLPLAIVFGLFVYLNFVPAFQTF